MLVAGNSHLVAAAADDDHAVLMDKGPWSLPQVHAT